MKTVKQLLMSMPSPLGEMAVSETIRQGYENELSDPETSLSMAIASSFTWRKSEMGHDFWEAVDNNAMHLEK